MAKKKAKGASAGAKTKKSKNQRASAKPTKPAKPVKLEKSAKAKPQKSVPKTVKGKAPVKASKATAPKASAKAPAKVSAPKAAAPEKSDLKNKPKISAPEVEVRAVKTEKAKFLQEEAVEAASEAASAGDSIAAAEVQSPGEEVVLTDAEGRRYCRVKDCDQSAMVDGYCRYHYLLYWKKIQIRKRILSEGKLERYIEELTARYPDKFLEMLRKDLRSEKEFLAAIQELEIDESANDAEFADDENEEFIEEVRNMAEPGTSSSEEF